MNRMQVNRLRIPVEKKARKLRGALGLGSGPEGRIEKIRMVLTGLIRHERLEGGHSTMDESRGYAELLIQQAIMNGPEHPETMEIANFWLLEKDLIPKLFNVLVPRYKDTKTSYTSLYRLPNQYPENRLQSLLELKGNPWPAVIQDEVDSSKWIHNVLLDSARRNLDKSSVDEAVEHDKLVDEMITNETSDRAAVLKNPSGTEV